MLKDLSVNLALGLRGALGWRLGDIAWRPRVTSYLGILALCALLVGYVDYSQLDGQRQFNPFGVITFSALLFFVLLVATVISAAQSAYARLPLLLTAGASLFFWYLLFLFVITGHLQRRLLFQSDWLPLLFSFLAVLLAVAAVRTSFRVPLLRSYLLSGGAVMLLFWLANGWYLSVNFFYSYPGDDYDRYYNVDKESVYYRQNQLVAKKVSALAPGDPAQSELYFVGFAGDGDESVFASEVRYAERIVQEKFLSPGRALHLASSFPRLEQEALANVYNLDAVLKAVAAKMDVADDVLFLFLTSHGSRDGSIEVSLTPFEMQALDAQRLRRSLDEAGIQWRIVVISACFSGSFVDALRNDNTIIVTAASAAKTSFGCSSDRELTYFGEALFRDAMARENDFIQAVEIARRIVSEREREEELEPSEPQLIVGAGMLKKLQSLGLTAQ